MKYRVIGRSASGVRESMDTVRRFARVVGDQELLQALDKAVVRLETAGRTAVTA